jgi:riboflavin biosynthesis pyrimidine reductase
LYGTRSANLPGVTPRFDAYCRRKEELARHAHPPGFKTVSATPRPDDALAVENAWTRTLFDGPFYVSRPPDAHLPATSLVFVQSRDGNTGADNPQTLGGGETDLHLLYEGLSRVAADAVLAGAATARSESMVFSTWHPELVALRRALGKPRHPAQVVVTGRGHLPLERGLMFTTPELRVWVIAPTDTAASLRERVRDRPWVEVLDAGNPPWMATALRQLRARGIETISAVGGRKIATTLIDEGLVRDLYLTTSPIDGGEPGTPFYEGPRPPMTRVLEKAGLGPEAGVRFEHFRLRSA